MMTMRGNEATIWLIQMLLYYNYVLTYHDDGGLLATETDPRGGGVHKFTYDAQGRLIRDEDPAGGFAKLDRTETETGSIDTLTSAEGRVGTFEVKRANDGGLERINTLVLSIYPSRSLSFKVIGISIEVFTFVSTKSSSATGSIFSTVIFSELLLVSPKLSSTVNVTLNNPSSP